MQGCVVPGREKLWRCCLVVCLVGDVFAFLGGVGLEI